MSLIDRISNGYQRRSLAELRLLNRRIRAGRIALAKSSDPGTRRLLSAQLREATEQRAAALTVLASSSIAIDGAIERLCNALEAA